VLQAEPSENRPNWYSHPGELIGATVEHDNDVIIMVQNASIEKLGTVVVGVELIIICFGEVRRGCGTSPNDFDF